MGKPHTPYLLAALALPVLLAGCSTPAGNPCDEPLSGEACRQERLLYQNDMLQAKLLIATGDLANYELAEALLTRWIPVFLMPDKVGRCDDSAIIIH